jgi:hypothetical protein
MANKGAVSRCVLLLSVGIFTAYANIAIAEENTANSAVVACLQTPAKLSDADIQAFMGTPQVLLTDNQVGGLPLSNRVRELAGSSSQAFAKIMELAKTANEQQKSAIAAGLARVVYTCGLVGSEEANNYGSLIQSQVAAMGDSAFAAAFLQSSSDVRTASLGPGSGNSLGGGSTATDNGQKGGDNKFKASGDGPTDTSSGAYTIGNVNPFGDASEVTSPSGS